MANFPDYKTVSARRAAASSMSVSPGYCRERKCDDCGNIEIVRKDNKAAICGRCSGKRNAIKGAEKKKKIAAESRRECLNCAEKVNSARAKFCSVKCKSEYARIDRECKHCAKSFSVVKSAIKENTNASGNFCSRQCYEKYLCKTGRTTGRGSQWNKIRLEVLRKFPFCARCGTRKNLQVHHITPFRLTADNSKENLVPLCIKHHKEIEMMFVETERFGVTQETEMIWRNMIRSMQSVTAFRIKEVNNAAA